MLNCNVAAHQFPGHNINKSINNTQYNGSIGWQDTLDIGSREKFSFKFPLQKKLLYWVIRRWVAFIIHLRITRITSNIVGGTTVVYELDIQRYPLPVIMTLLAIFHWNFIDIWQRFLAIWMFLLTIPRSL